MDNEEQGLVIRRMTPLDKEMTRSWYEVRGDPLPSQDFSGDLGFVVEHNGKLAACGYLFNTETKVCILEYFQTNHLLPVLTQSRAIKFLALSMIELAKTLKYKFIMGLVPEDNVALGKLYERHGAIAGRKKLINYYKEI